MRRSPSGVGIYVISLDTFMLLAVLGITIGILFIIISPMLNYTEGGIRGIRQNFSIEENEFQNFIDNIPNLYKVDNSYDGYPEKRLIEQNLVSKNLRWYKPSGNTFGQIRKTENDYNFLRLRIQEGFPGEKYISITSVEGISGMFINIDSIQQKIIGAELQHWPELKGIIP